MKHKVIKVTKKGKVKANNMLLIVLSGKVLEIKNSFEHKIAQKLIDCGIAKIVSKKNYGRIASITAI